MTRQHQYVYVNTDSIVGSHIPVPSKHSRPTIVLPKQLCEHISLHHSNTSRLFSFFKKTYDSKDHTYAIAYYIPLVQLSDEDIDEHHHNHMYLHLCLTGKHERHTVHNHIRVAQLSANVVVFPMFLATVKQTAVLLRLPTTHDMPTYIMHARDLHYVECHSIDSVNRAYLQATSPTAQAYVETSAKSRRLQQNGALADASHIGARIQTYDRLPTDTGRTVGKTLAHIKYHYGPNVVVKELDKTMVVASANDQHHTRRLLSAFSASTTIQHLLDGHLLETYINNKSKLAVVAVLPQMHLTHQLHIVAVALFEFVPAVLVARTKRTSHNRSHRAHIVLHHLLVDHRYDEYVLDRKHHRESNGIRQQLLRSAVPYTQKAFGHHDIYYMQYHKPTYKALLSTGFAKQQTKATLTQQLKTTLKRRKPPLKYTAKSITCSSWAECKQLVQEKYPNMALKDVLVMASDLCPSSQDKTAPTTPKRSRRPVSAQQGAKMLQSYYAHKLLEPAELSLEMPKKDMESAMEDAGKQRAVSAYCKAIRHHLRRTRKHAVLTAEKKNTWKFRPDPNADVTPDSKQGPDKYVLEELDAEREPGLSLVKRPMGRSTPRSLCEE